MIENTHDSKPTRRPIILNLADVKPQPVPWLWRPYIPLEMLSLLSGDPGAGKTTLALAIAAALTRGEVPFSDKRLPSPANVIYMTTENSPEYVLRPQFDLLRGAPEGFSLITGTEDSNGQNQKSISMSDVREIAAALQETKAKLVVLDPLQAYLGSEVDAHRANQTRPLLDGLGSLAKTYKCAILILRHLNKGVGGKAIYRGGGSIDFTGAARSELFLEQSPGDGSRRIMAHSKTNLGELGHSLVFTKDAEGALICEGESSFTADDLAGDEASEKTEGKVEQAKDFCMRLLSNGAIESRELERKAVEAQISTASLRRARNELGLESAPSGLRGTWMVSLPVTVAQETQS